MRSYAASEVAILRKVRVPNAVPYLFTALKIAAPAAVITAFVSEYFGGSQNGLGSRIICEHRDLEERDGLGIRPWCVPAGPDVLPVIAVALERVATPGGVAARRTRWGMMRTTRGIDRSVLRSARRAPRGGAAI